MSDLRLRPRGETRIAFTFGATGHKDEKWASHKNILVSQIVQFRALLPFNSGDRDAAKCKPKAHFAVDRAQPFSSKVVA